MLMLCINYMHIVPEGRSHFQPTVATNSYDVFIKVLMRLRLIGMGWKGLYRVTHRGPWIHPQKGAHMELYSFAHREAAKELLE